MLIQGLQDELQNITQQIEKLKQCKDKTKNEKNLITINLTKEKGNKTKEIITLKQEKLRQANEKFLFEKQILENTQIICTTLNSSGNERLRNVNLNFGYVYY